MKSGGQIGQIGQLLLKYTRVESGDVPKPVAIADRPRELNGQSTECTGQAGAVRARFETAADVRILERLVKRCDLYSRLRHRRPRRGGCAGTVSVAGVSRLSMYCQTQAAG